MDVDSVLQKIYDWPISEAIRTDYFWFPFFESIHVLAVTLVGAKIAGGLSMIFWIIVVFCGRWIGFTVI